MGVIYGIRSCSHPVYQYQCRLCLASLVWPVGEAGRCGSPNIASSGRVFVADPGRQLYIVIARSASTISELAKPVHLLFRVPFNLFQPGPFASNNWEDSYAPGFVDSVWPYVYSAVLGIND